MKLLGGSSEEKEVEKSHQKPNQNLPQLLLQEKKTWLTSLLLHWPRGC